MCNDSMTRFAWGTQVAYVSRFGDVTYGIVVGEDGDIVQMHPMRVLSRRRRVIGQAICTPLEAPADRLIECEYWPARYVKHALAQMYPAATRSDARANGG